MCPVLEEYSEDHTSTAEHPAWTWLGEAWVALARLSFELYVPDAVLDPLVVQDSEDRMGFIRSASLSDMIALISNHESICTGNPSNSIIEALSRERDTCSHAISHPISRRPDIPRLNALYSEISRFMEQLLPRLPSKSLSSPTRKAIQPLQDAVLQGSLGSFMQRLESSYADFGDLTQPLLWAVGCLRLGVSLSFVGDGPNAPSEAKTMAHSLVRFPSISSAENWSSTPTSNADVDRILHHIASIAYQVSIDGDISYHSHDLQRWFSKVVSLWLRDNEREQRERDEASSIYKTNKLDSGGLSDEQTEDEELRYLFPQYVEDADDISTGPAIGAYRATRTVSQEHMKDVLHLHFQLFQPAGHVNQDQSSYMDRRRNVLAHSFITTFVASSASLDAISQPWRVSLYHDLMSRFQKQDAGSSRLNFYRDPNPGETRRVIPVLRDLQLRLESILDEWPDQMVLRHLIDQCQKILDYPLRSPVARVLAALERLLIKTDDWEGYANRDNSLKSQQNSLIALIVEWRRLELQGWSQLLDSEAAAFNDEVSEWWFRLYEIFVIGTLSSAATDEANNTRDVEEHAVHCVPLIDDFMMTSPLGQFQARLGLLQSFCSFLGLLVPQETSPRSSALKHVSRLARSQADHYGFLLPDVQAELSRGKEPIQKDILDFIRLASWKDVNVYALKQSAEKTHRHLHRCIRKYRESLRRPVTAVGASPFQPLRDPPPIQNGDQISPAWKIATSSLNGANALDDSPRHLRKLAQTHSRFQQLLEEQMKLSSSDRHTSAVEELSSHIVETIQAFSSATMVIENADQRQKAINSMVSQKRRAIIDLMKELRRLGVSQNPKPEILARQRSRAKLFGSAIQHSRSDSALLSTTHHSSHYYHSLIDGLQATRDAVGSHHSDLTTRDIQRLLSLAESTFSFGLTAQEK
jgi:midasin